MRPWSPQYPVLEMGRSSPTRNVLTLRVARSRIGVRRLRITATPCREALNVQGGAYAFFLRGFSALVPFIASSCERTSSGVSSCAAWTFHTVVPQPFFEGDHESQL